MKKRLCVLLVCINILMIIFTSNVFADGVDLPDDTFGPGVKYLVLDNNEGPLSDETGYLTGVEINDNAGYVVSFFREQEIVTVRRDGTILGNDEIVATGDFVCIVNSEDLITDSISIVVKGDTSGDGKISSLDYLKVKKAFENSFSLRGCYAKAGDMNNDGVINASDYLKIKRAFLG